MSDTDTPRTDGQLYDPYPPDVYGTRNHDPYCMRECGDGDWVAADFARTLEIESRRLREALEELMHASRYGEHAHLIDAHDRARAALDGENQSTGSSRANANNQRTKEMKYAFQYFNGSQMVADEEGLSLDQAQALWSAHQAGFERNVERGRWDAQVCIWESSESTPYASELRHLRADACTWRNGVLYELVPAFPGER